MLQNWVSRSALRLSVPQRACHVPVSCFPIWTAPSLEWRDVRAISEDVEWLNDSSSQAEHDRWKTSILHGELCSMHLLPFFSCYLLEKEVSKFSTLEDYFLCRKKSWLHLPPRNQSCPASCQPRPSLPSSALPKAAHVRRLFRCCKESWLAGESHNRKKTQLDMTNSLTLSSTQIPLYSEATVERVFIEVTPFDLL